MLGASGVAWPSLLARLRDLVDLEGSAGVSRLAAAARGGALGVECGGVVQLDQ